MSCSYFSGGRIPRSFEKIPKKKTSTTSRNDVQRRISKESYETESFANQVQDDFSKVHNTRGAQMLKKSNMKTASDNIKNDQASKSLKGTTVKPPVKKLDPVSDFLIQRNIHAILDISKRLKLLRTRVALIYQVRGPIVQILCLPKTFLLLTWKTFT